MQYLVTVMKPPVNFFHLHAAHESVETYDATMFLPDTEAAQ